MRSVRPREPRVRGARLLLVFATLAALALGLAVAPSSSATADDDPAAANGITAIGGITAPVDGQFIAQNTMTISGTKDAGSTVAVTVNGVAGCASGTPDTAETWSCPATLPNGPNVVVTATETFATPIAGEASRVSTVTVDVLGPPTIDAVPPQTAPAAASGTGGYWGSDTQRSTIELLIGDVVQACTAPVAPDGRWVCTIARGPGTYTVKARQSMANLGTSAVSAAITLEIREAPPVDPPPPVAPPPAPAPVLPPPPPAPAPPVAPVEPTPAPAPSQTPSKRADAQTLPWLDRPIFPGPGGEGPTIREALTNWGSPTEFGTQLPTLRETVSGGGWAWAPLLALFFVLLFALPLRLLATTLRGRFWRPRLALTGRNRSRPDPPDDPAPRNPWLLGLVPLAATAGMITLAGGLGGEVRYLRLLFAVGLGLAILNIVGVAVATRFAATSQGVGSRLRFLPVLLLAAAVAALFSRVTGIEPPLISGVLIGTGFAFAVPARQRAIVNLTEVGTVLGLAVLAWIGHGWLGAVVGFWPSLLSETLATICLVGIGSAVMLMLPLGALPGRVILEWSGPAWFASTLLVATVAGTVLGGSVATFPVFATAVVITVFAAACVAVWAWANYVEASRA